jgi:hypothetical protein
VPGFVFLNPFIRSNLAMPFWLKETFIVADINILAVISKLRPRVKRGRTIDLDDLADEIAVLCFL